MSRAPGGSDLVMSALGLKITGEPERTQRAGTDGPSRPLP
jgi:hypothetical protein